MRALLPALLLMLTISPAGAELPAGPTRIEVAEPTGARPELPLPVWLHRPAAWRPGGPVLAVMHGNQRNGDHYRDDWAPLAEQHGLLLVVPEFSEAKYPGVANYNYGGAVDAEGRPRPREAWSFFALDRAVAAAQRAAGAAEGPFALFGHSAGSQFVHRYLLLTGAPRVGAIVIANAGSYTLPLTDRPFPEGLAGFPGAEAALRAAFARPVVVALGEADTDPNHDSLPSQPWARAQGGHRYARGWHFFDLARRQAAALGAPFAWRVLSVPGVGHQNAGMARAAIGALAGR